MDGPTSDGHIAAIPEASARGDVLSAAGALHEAVHALASSAVGADPDAVSLRRAADLVRQASAALACPPASVAGQCAPAAPDRDVLRVYRHRSLFQGSLHPFSPRLVWDAAEGPEGAPARRFTVTLSRLYQGPPGSVHGGYLSGLFDELLGGVQALGGGGGAYTARLTVRYRALTPIEAPLVFTGWITRDTGRRVMTAATCETADGDLTAEAEGLFVRPAGP